MPRLIARPDSAGVSSMAPEESWLVGARTGAEAGAGAGGSSAFLEQPALTISMHMLIACRNGEALDIRHLMFSKEIGTARPVKNSAPCGEAPRKRGKAPDS